MAGAAGMGPLNGSSHHAGGGSRSGAEGDRARDSADEFPPGATPAAPSPPTTTNSRSVSASVQYEREQRQRVVGSHASP